MAGAIFLMVILGGTTRLTESGLSITQWKLVSGTLPPLSQEAWQAEFAQYQQSPQFKITNHRMTLPEFKNIFWWEYVHRLWGRALGFFFFFPFVYFLWKRAFSAGDFGKLFIALILGGSQGLLGWYMVKSGLVDVPRVSGYRLTAHLLLATALMGYVLWLGLDFWFRSRARAQGQSFQPAASSPFFPIACALTVLVFIQVGLGGLMAGTKAGVIYPAFPTLNGHWAPFYLMVLGPGWRNFFENPATIQLVHRIGAIVVSLAIFAFWLFLEPDKSKSKLCKILGHALPILVIIQFLLGVLTLLGSIGHIPVFRGVLHQGTGILLFAACVALTRGLKGQREEDVPRARRGTHPGSA